jgi:hypothetical protein
MVSGLESASRRDDCDLSKNRPSDAYGAPNLSWQGLTSGVTKNRQVKVTKVTGSSHFGNGGSRRAYPTLIARDPDHVDRTLNPRSA